ncbi:hypothetical protein ERC79_04055 [Rhodococcus sp. ABRD24]|uniref:hypothetical protein n=1 Tax=Rhodococcus sp. ABRD24 TaxID=2507582 RepID=UPI00103A5BE9|nr:hypothetical protein [Rhodococcus sp. ABRD24]QBJ95221.1 hypothetical protein ERC79_04055 [Rhodococcus sp. ABRD24]
MPRRQEHSEQYADALVALAAATHRPVNVVNADGEYAIRVDFAFGVYALATNSESGLSADPDAGEVWRVRFVGQREVGDELLSEARHEWLADAFDAALDEFRRAGHWKSSDAMLHELARRPGEPEPDGR